MAASSMSPTVLLDYSQLIEYFLSIMLKHLDVDTLFALALAFNLEFENSVNFVYKYWSIFFLINAWSGLSSCSIGLGWSQLKLTCSSVVEASLSDQDKFFSSKCTDFQRKQKSRKGLIEETGQVPGINLWLPCISANDASEIPFYTPAKTFAFKST